MITLNPSTQGRAELLAQEQEVSVAFSAHPDRATTSGQALIGPVGGGRQEQSRIVLCGDSSGSERSVRQRTICSPATPFDEPKTRG
jgi:hypothetical protein